MTPSRWFVLLAIIPGVARAEPPGKAPTPPPRAASVPGPTQTDPDKYHLVLENERVRVFRYHDVPGAKTRMHHHEAFVLYALAPFTRRLVFPDGTTKERAFVPGDVIYMDAQDHVGENVGTTDTDVLIVELKEPGAAAKASPAGWKPGEGSAPPSR